MLYLDLLSQVVIMFGGLLAIILVSYGNRWGFVVGLIQQPFWFFATIYNNQWGMFALSVAYFFTWCIGIYNAFFKKKDTGMSKEKVLEVIGVYRAMFMGKDISKTDYPHEHILHDPLLGMAHCHGMLDKMEEFTHQGRREKVFRWLGFVQGFLWSQGVYTLNQLRDHNRP